MADERTSHGDITNNFYNVVNKVVNNYGTLNEYGSENYGGDNSKQIPHFPLNKCEEEGKQWFDFLIAKGFIERDSELDCWLYLMGFSSSQPTEVKPIAWLKTVETARMMLRKVHGNLIDAKKLSVVKMEELASQCFIKQGEPLKLAKPKKEISADADEIENFLPTISDL
jgi:hypothetical protein